MLVIVQVPTEKMIMQVVKATRAIADWCENLAMMATYLELAAKWMQMAKQSPPVSAHETH